MLQNQTVDLCKLMSWPLGATVRVRETTLSGNRGLRAFAAAGGRLHFTAQPTAQCFKEDAADCGAVGGAEGAEGAGDERPAAVVCGDADAIDAAGVDCASGSVMVCVDAMDVRTFVLAVQRSSG